MYFLTIGRSMGLLTKKADQSLIMLALEGARAGQWRRICWRFPSWLKQPGSLHRPSGLSLVQCLARRSVLYLPDSILAAMTALETSYGLWALVQIGCGEERDIKEGLK